MLKSKVVIPLFKQIRVDLDKNEKTLENLFKITQKYFSNNIFGVLGEKTWTYKQLDYYSNQVANYLIKNLGNKESNIFLKANNSPYLVFAFYGILKANKHPTLINPNIDDLSYQQLIKEFKPVLIIDDKNIQTISNEEVIDSYKWSNSFTILSSGTTGKCKTIIFNGSNVWEQMNVLYDIAFKTKDITMNWDIDKIKILALLPFYHIFGLSAVLLWFTFFGRQLIFLSDLSPNTIKQTCINQKVTHIFAVPLLYESIYDKVIKKLEQSNLLKKVNRLINISIFLQKINANLGIKFAKKVFKSLHAELLGSNLTYLISGGSFIKSNVLRFFNGIGYRIHNGYGLSECGIISVELSRCVNKLNKTSVGQIFNRYQYKIENKSLYLKSDCIASNIVNNDGWYDTKDNAIVNKSNRLIIQGRSDDAIIATNGENIYSSMIEKYFQSLPIQTYFIGIKQRSLADGLIMFIKFNEIKTNELLNKIESIIDKLPWFLKPKEIYQIIQFPIGASGKIKTNELKSNFINNRNNYTRLFVNSNNESANINIDSQLQNTIDQVKLCIAKSLNIDIKQINNNTHLINDLAISSLDYYAIIHDIQEQFKATNLEVFKDNNNPMTPLEFALLLTNKTKSIG